MLKKVTIIKNPIKEDLLLLDTIAKQENVCRSLETVRFMADATKNNVFIADAWNITHSQLSERFNIEFKYREKYPWLYFGSATVNNGIATNIPHLYYSLRDQLYYNWSFVENYIIGFVKDLYAIKQKRRQY